MYGETICIFWNDSTNNNNALCIEEEFIFKFGLRIKKKSFKYKTQNMFALYWLLLFLFFHSFLLLMPIRNN